MEEFESRYAEVMVHPDHIEGARSLKPLHERQVFGRSVFLFDHLDRGQLAALGDVRTPSIADLFVAVMSPLSQKVPARQADQIGTAT
jgi:ABC-2 type transport system ATP-binding protein